MRIRLIGLLFFICFRLGAQENFDLVIVGGTPGGIMAAVEAARLGKTSVILERTGYIGGLPTNGLGATDINTRGATTGLFGEFIARVKDYYIKNYGAGSLQVRMCSDGYHFEPSVASGIFDEMIREQGDKISVRRMRQFDSDPENVVMKDNRVVSIQVIDREKYRTETYSGKMFIDATYEGDLGAAAGIPFRVGREGYSEFKEEGAGRIYKYWDGPIGAGSTSQGDNAVQAYNYRLCLTDDPANGVAVQKPQNYDREEYVSLIDDVLLNRHTSSVPVDVQGIAKLVNSVPLPNAKTDANNQHLAFLSTDLPEENWAWPTSSWEWRDQFAKRLKEYTLGLLWFAQNDGQLPSHFRKAVARWQLAGDEYPDNDNFPRQVYVREGRRFLCSYFFTATDALPVAGGRPPVHSTSITSSHYALDSHAVRKREEGRVHLDGFLSYPSVPYTVPLGVVLPREVDNLLIPVAVSGSHIGFSTLRMEPCWMALGQAAGVVSSLAIDTGLKLKNVPIETIQEVLLNHKATLIFIDDVTPADQDFRIVQYLGVRGYLPGWSACPEEPVDEQTLTFWSGKSGLKLNARAGLTKRIDVLREIYSVLHGD